MKELFKTDPILKMSTDTIRYDTIRYYQLWKVWIQDNLPHAIIVAHAEFAINDKSKFGTCPIEESPVVDH